MGYVGFKFAYSDNPGHNIIGILPKIKVMLSLSPPPLAPLVHDEPDLDFLAALVACSKKKVKQHWPGWRGRKFWSFYQKADFPTFPK